MKSRSTKKLLLVLTIVIVAQLLFISSASAAVTYSDWRNSTPSIFEKVGSEWTQQLSGGYDNTGVTYKCYPANGWTFAQLGSARERGYWHAYNKTNFLYGELQAYITSWGTNNRARYGDYSFTSIFNQYTHHGWSTIHQNGMYSTYARLDDYHDGYGWWDGQRSAFDAVRWYY